MSVSVLKTANDLLFNDFEDEKWCDVQESLIQDYKALLKELCLNFSYSNSSKMSERVKKLSLYYINLINEKLFELATNCICSDELDKLIPHISFIHQLTHITLQADLVTQNLDE